MKIIMCARNGLTQLQLQWAQTITKKIECKNVHIFRTVSDAYIIVFTVLKKTDRHLQKNEDGNFELNFEFHIND